MPRPSFTAACLSCSSPRVERTINHHTTKDGIFFIIKGTGEFEVEGKEYPFEAGDALFVPAGKEHRFRKFSDDLVTWAVFYGPAGGEQSKPVPPNFH